MRFAFPCLLLAACGSLAWARSSEVVLSTTALLPGQTLRVEVDGVLPEARLKASFLGKSYPFFVVGPDSQRALIGVPLGQDPGVFSLSIKGLVSRDVVVATRTYVTENVSFSPAKTALMTAEKREGAIIGRQKKRLSREQGWEGLFGEPVKGPIIGEFGLKRLRNKTIVAGFHKGADIRAAAGTPVLAANAGVVLLASSFTAHGKTVLSNHGQGVMSIYLHMQKLLVRPGQKVRKGEVIGLVGSTGLATAPHMHWQVYVHGVPVDPAQWLETEF